jgi:hypothetical protein
VNSIRDSGGRIRLREEARSRSVRTMVMANECNTQRINIRRLDLHTAIKVFL